MSSDLRPTAQTQTYSLSCQFTPVKKLFGLMHKKYFLSVSHVLKLSQSFCAETEDRAALGLQTDTKDLHTLLFLLLLPGASVCDHCCQCLNLYHLRNRLKILLWTSVFFSGDNLRFVMCVVRLSRFKKVCNTFSWGVVTYPCDSNVRLNMSNRSCREVSNRMSGIYFTSF